VCLFIDNALSDCEAKTVEVPAEEMDSGSPEPPQTPLDRNLTPAEVFIQRQMHVAEAKEQIAALCTAVISSPENDVMIMSCSAKHYQ